VIAAFDPNKKAFEEFLLKLKEPDQSFEIEEAIKNYKVD
jgi:hypothetical protein